MTFGEGATMREELMLWHDRDAFFVPYKYYVMRDNTATGARTLHRVPVWRVNQAHRHFKVLCPLYPRHMLPTDKYKLSKELWRPIAATTAKNTA